MAYTAPRTWIPSEVVTAALLNTHVRDNFKAIGDPWIAYTPTWKNGAGGADLLPGNGTLVGKYLQVGKLVHFRIEFTRGSTTNVGTTSYSFGFPVTPSSFRAHGPAYVYGSAALFMPHLWAGTGGLEFCVVSSSGRRIDGNGYATAPSAWVAGDVLSIYGTYEAA